jgi:Restriction endonuclease
VSTIHIGEYEALILGKSNAEKQEYGGRLVEFVGGVAGPRGRDEGVDGWYEPDSGETIYFQVKLSKNRIPRDVVKLMRQTCEDRGSSKAILISVKGLSSEALKYADEHAGTFSLCHLAIADILMSRHFATLEAAGFQEAQLLATKLTGAVGRAGSVEVVKVRRIRAAGSEE